MTAFASRSLVDHFGEWITEPVHDDPGATRIVGVSFACPHCHDIEGSPTLAVLFANPPDGGSAAADDAGRLGNNEGRRWTRIGDQLEFLTLSPSVDCSKCGHWHGNVTCGLVG